ncbi:MAG: DUF2214 family protein [Cyclobacteriaceae bacterium]
MTPYIIVKYIHFLSIFGMLSFLFAELVMVKNSISRDEISLISKIDGLYGLMAVLVVGAGFTLWFGVGKPEEFYNNPIFHIKIGLAVLVGLISIIPTVFYIKNRKGDPNAMVVVPARIKKLIILQLTILAFIPLLAVLMANGIKF